MVKQNMKIAFRCAEISNYLVFKTSSSSSNTIVAFHSNSLRLASEQLQKKFPKVQNTFLWWTLKRGYFKGGCVYLDSQGRHCHLPSHWGFPLVSFCHFISILHSAPCSVARPHFSCNQPLRANQEVKKRKTPARSQFPSLRCSPTAEPAEPEPLSPPTQLSWSVAAAAAARFQRGRTRSWETRHGREFRPAPRLGRFLPWLWPLRPTGLQGHFQMEQSRGEQPALLSDQLPGGGCHDDFRCGVSGVPLPDTDRGRYRGAPGVQDPGM